MMRSQHVKIYHTTKQDSNFYLPKYRCLASASHHTRKTTTSPYCTPNIAPICQCAKPRSYSLLCYGYMDSY